MNSSIGEEVIKIYGKELSGKAPGTSHRIFRQMTWIVLVLTFAVLVALALITVFYFNKFIGLQQNAFAQGSRVESEYQRRADHISKLAGIAMEYAAHEQALFKYVSDSRELKLSLKQTAVSPELPDNPKVEAALSKLMAIAEQYPNLKATQGYQSLMEKIETTENRISTARGAYSALINKYNKTVCAFPDNMFASMLGFETLQPYHPEKEPMPLRDRRIFWP